MEKWNNKLPPDIRLTIEDIDKDENFRHLPLEQKEELIALVETLARALYFMHKDDMP